MTPIFLSLPDYLDFSHPLTVVLWLAAIVLALSLHEFSHALTATVLGDNTARAEGRLSLNPLVHIDPMGLLLAVVAGFGWAKPVPFNPYNLRVQKWGPTLVAFAGPISNFLQAAIAAVGIRLAVSSGFSAESLLVQFLGYYFFINIGLCFFNLLPIPPLDGSKLLLDALAAPQYARARFLIETQGPMVLIGIMALQYLVNISIFGALFAFFFRFVFFPIFGIVVNFF